MLGFDLIIKSRPGKLTNLDKKYRVFVVDKLSSSCEDEVYKWEVYNTIVGEVIRSGNAHLFDEVKYRISGGEDPNDVFLDVIDTISNDDISLFKKNINTFKEEEFFKRFDAF